MTLVLLIGLAAALALVLAARRGRPRITHIERTIEKDRDDA